MSYEQSEKRKAYKRDYFKRNWLFNPQFKKKKLLIQRAWWHSEAGKVYTSRPEYLLKKKEAQQKRRRTLRGKIADRIYARKYWKRIKGSSELLEKRRAYMKAWRKSEKSKIYQKAYYQEYKHLDKYKDMVKHYYHVHRSKKEFSPTCNLCQQRNSLTGVDVRPSFAISNGIV